MATLIGGTPVATSPVLDAIKPPPAAFLIRGTSSVLEVAHGNKAVERALAEAVITLRIAKHPFRAVLDHIPGLTDAEVAVEAAHDLRTAMASAYGTALKHFANKLAKARRRDEGKLRKDIRADIEQFRVRVAADPDDYAAVNIANAFGLVAAASRLAKKFGVLPQTWPDLSAAFECYAMREQKEPEKSILERLEAIADQATRLAKGALPKKKEITKVGTFIVENSDCRELLIRPEVIGEVFKDWCRLRNHSSMDDYRVRDKTHLKPKRSLHPKLNKVRIFVFRLPK